MTPLVLNNNQSESDNFQISTSEDFYDRITVSTTFKTTLEYNGFSYSDRTRTVKAFFNVSGIDTTVSISVLYNCSFIQASKVITKDKATSVETDYIINESDVLEIESYESYKFIFYLKYYYSYTGCIDWDEIFCHDDEFKEIDREYYSEEFDFSPPFEISMEFLMLIGVGLVGICIAVGIRNSKKL